MLIVLLIVSMLVAGCGQKAQTPQEPAKELPVVKIGFIGPLTGPNAYQGVGARNAFEMAVKMANEAGDLPYKLETIVLDDASDPSTGASAALKIVNDEAVVAAIGHWNSPVAMATIPFFKAAKIPFMIWGAISPALTSAENYPYSTRICLTLIQQNEALANFLVDQMGYKRFAIISDTTTFGVTNTKSWTSILSNKPGTELVDTHEIHVGETDFRAVLASIKAKNPQVIYFGGVVTEAALVRRQMNEAGMENVLLAGISGMADEKFVEVATAAKAEGTITSKPGRSIEKMPLGPQFIERYQKEGFAEPYGVYGPYAFDAVNIILAALKKVGPDTEKLTQAIADIEYDGLLGKTSFDNIGQTKNYLVTIQVVDDGKFVDWEDSKYFSGQKTLQGK
jgi:branched-chain amino acid transport system substrate-binding protein